MVDPPLTISNHLHAIHNLHNVLSPMSSVITISLLFPLFLSLFFTLSYLLSFNLFFIFHFLHPFLNHLNRKQSEYKVNSYDWKCLWTGNLLKPTLR